MLAALEPAAAGSSSEDDGDDEQQQHVVVVNKKSAFALLGGDNDSEAEADDSDEEEPPPVAAAAPAPSPPPQPTHSAASKQANKKARKKANKAAAAAAAASSAAGDDDDDFGDEEEMKMLEASAAGNVALSRAAAIHSVHVVDTHALDADAEMRKRFGSRAVRVAQREAAAEDRQQIRGHGRGGGGRAAPTPRRVLVVTPQSAWGRPHGLVSMRELKSSDAASAASGSVYQFVWSSEYERLHETFEVLVASSADPNMLMELLRQQPCHLGALAQLHEVATQTGQAELASEYLQRVLWVYEASFAPGFKEAMLRGEARLRYGHPPNRPYFRAMHKQVVALGRRGCHRAALATASLLLSLDRNDPTKIRLWLDLLALRAEQPHVLWLHSLDDPADCMRLPGWAFSYAIALREIARTTSTASAPLPVPPAAAAAVPDTPPWSDGGELRQLRRALLTWPDMLPAALQACAASSSAATALAARWQTAVDAAEAAAAGVGGGGGAGGGGSSSTGSGGSSRAPNGALAHVMILYWERATDMWGGKPDRMPWLQEVATALAAELEQATAVAAAKAGGESGEGGGRAGGCGGCGASSDNGGNGVLAELRERREQARRFYPPGGGNPYRSLEFTTLRAEQVVIPEEEAPPEQPQPPPQEQAVDVGDVEAGHGGGGGAEGVDGAVGGDDSEEAVLAPLLEEAEALTTRVDEMERLTKQGGAAHLRAIVAQRMLATDERLTRQMIAIDTAVVQSETARNAKRALTRRMDALCTRMAAIDVKE